MQKAHNFINTWFIVYLLFQNIYSEVDEAKNVRLTKYLYEIIQFSLRKSQEIFVTQHKTHCIDLKM